MTDLNQQPSYRELRLEGEARGIVSHDNAKQSKDELAQALTSARIQEAVSARRGGNK